MSPETLEGDTSLMGEPSRDTSPLPAAEYSQLTLPIFLGKVAFAQRPSGDYFADQCTDVPFTD